MKYKVVCVIEFADGNEEHVIWELKFYGDMVKKGVDIYSLFYDMSLNGFSDLPVGVNIGIYENPIVEKIGLRLGDNEVQKELLIGELILPLKFL
jgi:hypothetical protein